MIGQEADMTMTASALGSPENPRYAADGSLYVRFYTRMVENHNATVEEGRRIREPRDYVIIMTPGGKNSIIDRPVTDQDSSRFADKYEQFKKNEEQRQAGTPLMAWTAVTEAQARDLEINNIFTVEQLAEMPDVACQRIMGGNNLKAKAKQFIDRAKEDAPFAQLQQEVDKREDENAVLRDQIEKMNATMAEMMAKMDDGAPAVDAEAFIEPTPAAEPAAVEEPAQDTDGPSRRRRTKR